MAISILNQPTNLSGIFRAYEPLVYRVGVSGVTNAPVCKAQLYINNVLYGAAQTATHIIYDSNTNTYLFKFDATALIRDYPDNEATWGALNAQTSTTVPNATDANTGFYEKMVFYFVFTEYIIIPPNPRLQQGDSVTSDAKEAVNARADTTTGSLYPYVGVFPSLWLTNAPLLATTSIKEIELTQSDFLSYYSQGANNPFAEIAKITTYNSALSLINTYYIDVNSPANNNRLRRVGTGSTNINNTPSAQFLSPPIFPIINNNVYYYEVSIIFYDKVNNISLGNLTRVCRYYLKKSCEKIQLFYTNEFGADDNLSFKLDNSSIDYENEQSEYTAPIFNVIPRQDMRGSQTINSNSTQFFTLNGSFPEQEIKRIKECWNSPNLAIVLPDNPTQYIKVVNAKTGQIRIQNSDEDGGGNNITVEFVLQQSAKDFSHEN
jgi:hypothetical protein